MSDKQACKPTWFQGEPTNIEAAAADALMWLDLLAHNASELRMPIDDYLRLTDCCAALARFVVTQQAAASSSEPIGWLYDWMHSSALGKPDEVFTSFTTDEAHARKHDNARPVYAAAQSSAKGGKAATDKGEPAPGNSLPDWGECQRVIDNAAFRKRAEAGLEGSVLATPPTTPEPTELHRFIYEYDDADPYRSAWFLHRLELLLNEVRAGVAKEEQARTEEVRVLREVLMEVHYQLSADHECGEPSFMKKVRAALEQTK